MEKSRKAVSALVALFTEDECRFLTSQDNLLAFLGKVRGVLHAFEIASRPKPTELKSEVISTFICMKEILQSALSTIGALDEMQSSVENSGADGLLSVEESKSISDLMKYISSFFISPFLEVRFGSSAVDARSAPIYSSFTPREKITLLHNCLVGLCRICEGNQTMQGISIKCLSLNILNSLMQLCFSPSSARILDIDKRRCCLQFLNSLTTGWMSEEHLIEDAIILQGSLSKNTPAWLQKKCGKMLTGILLRENGVATVINTIVTGFSGTQPGDERGWERVVALSSLLSTLPSSGITTEGYCRLVCPQLVNLLKACRKNSSEHSKDAIRIAVITLHALHEKFPAESASFEEIICKPLSNITDYSEFEKLQLTDIYDDLENCIENLHQICVSVGIVPHTLVSILLKPYVKVFLLLLVRMRSTSSHLKSLIFDLFVVLLKSVDQDLASELILSSFSGMQDSKTLNSPIKELQFFVDEDGKMLINLHCSSHPSKILSDLDAKVDILLDIITKVDGLSSRVFLQLIKNLCNPLKNIPSEVNTNKISSPEERTVEAMELNEERFITFGLLNLLIETCDHTTLLQDVSQILDFIKITLSSIADKFKDENEDLLESVKICTSVIGVCLLSEINPTQRQCLMDIVAEFKKISDLPNFLNPEMKSLISDLIVAISTYGAVNEMSATGFSDVMKKYMEQFNSSKTDENSAKTNGTISSRETSEPDIFDQLKSTHHPTGILSENTASELSEKSFHEALKDVYSSSPALKGGSIRHLTKCINKGLTIATTQLEKLTNMFLESLDDIDSFVYLSAVQGLSVAATLGGKHLQNDEVFSKILQKFLGNDLNSMHGNFDHVAVSRMKLGEVITRVIKTMGDMAPHHASVLLPEFLRLARHEDPSLRASSLSNFGEIAPMAPYMISSIEYEIKDCLCGICKTDKDQLVRRSAIHAIRQIVEKLSDTVLVILPNTIKEIYRTVKDLYHSDSDDTMQLHAQLTLEELDKIMRATLFKPPELSKKITVLP